MDKSFSEYKKASPSRSLRVRGPGECHDTDPMSSQSPLLTQRPVAAARDVLVVDDDPIKRYTVVRSLERAGFNLIEAETGTEGLRLARNFPGLVILDVKLPDIDGFEVCRRIKADPQTVHVPVLHLSAHRTSGRDLAQGLEGGADAYLALPVEPEVLVATVRALLRLYEAEEEARTAADYWRATFDAISDAVFLVGPGGVVTRGNAAAGALTGTDPDGLSGVPFRSVLDGLGLGDLSEFIEAGKQSRTAAEVRIGDDRWARLTVDPVRGGKTSPEGVVCTLSDITARVRAEEIRAEAAAKNERIAETLQRSLLLNRGAVSFLGVEVEGSYEAASDESLVGGDFSDVFAIDGGRVALVVGDVTGKGLAAAIYTAEIKFALRAFLRESANPARALYRLNHYLLESRRLESDASDVSGAARDDRDDRGGPTTYVSLALAVVDTTSRVAACAAAGAEPPLVVRHADGAAEAVEGAIGPLLVVDADPEYHAADVRLERGDLLLLATDGITEARAPGRGREFFGPDGMARTAGRARHGTVRAVADAVVREALAFAGGYQSDDVCLLVARCAGGASDG